MPTLLRTLRLLCLCLWVGGIAFLAFVVAPVAFHGLSSVHEAGIVVRGSLLILHRIGLVCGLLVLATLRFSGLRSAGTSLATLAVIALMLLLTFFSQQFILPSMERDRLAAGGEIDAAPPQDPHRLHFEHLHILSERMEGGVLLLGIAAVVLFAREPTEP